MRKKLTLVGAGPGDPELISLKGIRALAAADVILYDALVNPVLLEYASPAAPQVFVGKRAANHRYSQEEINQLIVGYALSYGHVVRLKGGDPFIFGRGHEELEYARLFDIETEVIPGISSGTSLPALQGVPLTRRGLNESFWVLTATTRSGAISADLPIAAQSSATVVILMGMQKLAEITAQFAAQGKAQTPAMIIQNGSLPDEKVVLGTVDTLAEEARKAGMGSPAIIVIGEVVRLHPDYVREYALYEYAQQRLAS